MSTDRDNTASTSAVSVGLRGRCPRCGKGPLFKGFLDLAPSCTVCGLDYGFADAGDGPAVFVTMIAGTIVVGLALWTEVTYEPPFWVHLAIFLPLTLVLCLGTLRPIKGLLIALQYRNKAEQGRFDS
ncbi:DUF983 domain-containing protein [Lichenihabitans psoromatis]|uniref:DUF983 domain-containing protein n=1 Tax=Lichenihabitans psoromatis TaxID=2528642 RepID=UPI0010367C23|nr:DUF983 domain-containing protein [Lichenihabitans psoromatis]